jgi:hypothetical protein
MVQQTPIPRPPLDLPDYVWIGLFLSCGLASSVLCDALWDTPISAAFLIAGTIVIGARHKLRQADTASTGSWLTLAIVIYEGLLVGCLLLGTAMLSWFLAEVLTRGRNGVGLLWCS